MLEQRNSTVALESYTIVSTIIESFEPSMFSLLQKELSEFLTVSPCAINLKLFGYEVRPEKVSSRTCMEINMFNKSKCKRFLWKDFSCCIIFLE